MRSNMRFACFGREGRRSRHARTARGHTRCSREGRAARETCFVLTSVDHGTRPLPRSCRSKAGRTIPTLFRTTFLSQAPYVATRRQVSLIRGAGYPSAAKWEQRHGVHDTRTTTCASRAGWRLFDWLETPKRPDRREPRTRASTAASWEWTGAMINRLQDKSRFIRRVSAAAAACALVLSAHTAVP